MTTNVIYGNFRYIKSINAYSFCGVTYTFLFVPGMANLMVRGPVHHCITLYQLMSASAAERLVPVRAVFFYCPHGRPTRWSG